MLKPRFRNSLVYDCGIHVLGRRAEQELCDNFKFHGTHSFLKPKINVRIRFSPCFSPYHDAKVVN